MSNTTDSDTKDTLKLSFYYYGYILFCIKEDKLTNIEKLSQEKIESYVNSFLEEISVEELFNNRETSVFKKLIREFLDEYRRITLDRDLTETSKAFSHFKNYFFEDLQKEEHPILFSRFLEFFFPYLNAKTSQTRDKLKEEYRETLEEIIDIKIPYANLILESFKPFESYITKKLEIKELASLVYAVNNIITRILTTEDYILSSEDSKRLEIFNKKILDYKSMFCEYVMKYNCDPMDVLLKMGFENKHIPKLLEENNVTLEVVKEIDEAYPIKLWIHPKFLEIIFEEIPKNISRYAKNATCKLLLKRHQDEFVIHFKQDKPKVSNEDGAGGRGFKKIADLHDIIFTEDDFENYEFQFVFKKHLID